MVVSRKIVFQSLQSYMVTSNSTQTLSTVVNGDSGSLEDWNTPIVISAPQNPQIHLLFVTNLNSRASFGCAPATGLFPE